MLSTYDGPGSASAPLAAETDGPLRAVNPPSATPQSRHARCHLDRRPPAANSALTRATDPSVALPWGGDLPSTKGPATCPTRIPLQATPAGGAHTPIDILNHLAAWLEPRCLSLDTGDLMQAIYELALRRLADDECARLTLAARRWIPEPQWTRHGAGEQS